MNTETENNELPDSDNQTTVLNKGQRWFLRIFLLGVLTLMFFGWVHSLYHSNRYEKVYNEKIKEYETYTILKKDTISSIEELELLHETGYLDKIDLYIVDSLGCNCPGIDKERLDSIYKDSLEKAKPAP